MPRERPYPLVEVSWDDATHVSHWDTAAGHKKWRMADCHSVGYLLLRTPKYIKLLMTYAVDPDRPVEEPDTNFVQCIPRGFIKAFRVLRK